MQKTNFTFCVTLPEVFFNLLPIDRFSEISSFDICSFRVQTMNRKRGLKK